MSQFLRVPSDDGLTAGERSTLPAGLLDALRWLGQRLDEPIRLDDLAAAAGVRPRTLEAHFKQHLGITPLGWVRKTRLARARQQLLAGGEHVNVTEIALASGFSQLGRFASQYRKQFGELPSQTLRSSRNLPDAGVNDEALRLSWQAITSAFMVGPAACRSALDAVERAQELAPGFALPKAVAAWCWSQSAAHGFTDTPLEDRARGLRLADEAMRLAPSDSLVLSLCSGALTLSRKLKEADQSIERSLAMEPWSPWAWIRRAWLSAYQGDDDGALRELQMTLQLMPFEPMRHLAFIGTGCVHFNAGRYDRAAKWVQAGVESGPQSFWAERVYVAALAQTGASAEARREARQLLRKDKHLTVARAQNAWPFPPAFMQRLGDGLSKAGVPRA